jgi:hypothetical protein
LSDLPGAAEVLRGSLDAVGLYVVVADALGTSGGWLVTKSDVLDTAG